MFTTMNQVDTYRHKGLRKELAVKLRDKGIADANVLKAIEAVPRHLFFGDDTIFFETHAYEDKAFPISEGQTISQPYTVAFQSELVEVKPRVKILEVGTGSGYQSAVLSTMGAKVFTIERHRKLYERTKPLLEKLGYSNVKCFFGDGFEGLPAYGPFDKIIITASVGELPKKLLQQLTMGGKMVIPFGTEASCDMVRITRQGEAPIQRGGIRQICLCAYAEGKGFLRELYH